MLKKLKNKEPDFLTRRSGCTLLGSACISRLPSKQCTIILQGNAQSALQMLLKAIGKVLERFSLKHSGELWGIV